MLFVVWVYRQVFWCCRRIDSILFSPEKKDDSVPVTSLPWLWIGATLDNGHIEEYTSQINETVVYGVAITPEWLEAVTYAKNVTWKYLDSKTLEEKEFPSAGFVIDDPFQPDPEDSDDE
jgi:hypothetical protein